MKSANRVTWLVTRALELEEAMGLAPIPAFERAREEGTRRYGAFSPGTLSFARRILAASRRRLLDELAERCDNSENMRRQITGVHGG